MSLRRSVVEPDMLSPGKRLSSLLFVLVVSATAACASDSMDIYGSDQINSITVTQLAPGQLRITVAPMLETLHAFAGANVESTPEGRTLVLVRCPLKSQCPVDVPAEPAVDDPAAGILQLADDGRAVAVRYSDGVVPLWPR